MLSLLVTDTMKLGSDKAKNSDTIRTEKEAVNALESLPQNMIKDNINITLRQLL